MKTMLQKCVSLNYMVAVKECIQVCIMVRQISDKKVIIEVTEVGRNKPLKIDKHYSTLTLNQCCSKANSTTKPKISMEFIQYIFVSIIYL